MRNGAPGKYISSLFTNNSNTPVSKSGAATAATDARDAITPCTKPCWSSATLLAANAVSKGGAISDRAAIGIIVATAQAAVENPKPNSAITAAILAKIRVL